MVVWDRVNILFFIRIKCIQSKIYISMHLWISICYYHYSLWRLKCPRFGQWKPLGPGFSVTLTCPHHSSSTSLLSGTTRYSRLILYTLSPSLGINHFSKEFWFVLVKKGSVTSAGWYTSSPKSLHYAKLFSNNHKADG